MYPIQYLHSVSSEMMYLSYKAKYSDDNTLYRTLETGLSFLDSNVSKQTWSSYQYLMSASLSILKANAVYQTLSVHSEASLTLQSAVYCTSTQEDAFRLIAELDDFHTTLERLLPTLLNGLHEVSRPLRRVAVPPSTMFIEQFGAVYMMLKPYFTDNMLLLQSYIQLSTVVTEDLWLKLRLVLQQLSKNRRLNSQLILDPKLFIEVLLSVFLVSTYENIVELLLKALETSATLQVSSRSRY